MRKNELNLFTTKNGTVFITPDKDLTEDSIVKVLSVFSGFNPAKKLGSFLWTKKCISLVEYLGSYESLEAALKAVKTNEAGLEAAFN
jgi:hypothetical protein